MERVDGIDPPVPRRHVGRDAFQDLYGIAADIGRFTDAGMTDPLR